MWLCSFGGSKLCPVHRAEAQKGREGNKMRDEHKASVASDALLPLARDATDRQTHTHAHLQPQTRGLTFLQSFALCPGPLVLLVVAQLNDLTKF